MLSLFSRPLPRWAELTILGLIIAAAAFLRFYEIGSLPPGPHYDEAGLGLDALEVLAGHHALYFLRSLGEEALFVYIATPLIALWGPTLLALRLPTTLAGVLTIPGVYLLTREILHDEDERRAQWAALFAALFLALPFEFLAINRLAFRANYVPLFEVYSFYFFWRALRTGRNLNFILSGLLLGLCLNTYIAARFVPVVLILFLALLLPTRNRNLVLFNWRGLVLLGGTALVLYAPLLVFFALHPELFSWRASFVSILNPNINQGDPLGLLLRSIMGNLEQFGGAGDPHWLWNIPGRSTLDPIQATLFWLGLLSCLIRWRQPRYLFVPIWFAAMLLPSILAPDPIPHTLRSIGAAPAVATAAALLLTVRLPPLPRFARLVPVAVSAALVAYLAWAGYNTFDLYFRYWLSRDEVYFAYYAHVADLARQMNLDVDPSTVYVVPINYDRKGEDYHEYDLELLHRSGVPFHYIVVDDATVAADLTHIVAGKRRVQLVVWSNGDHVDSDPRQVLPFYLQRFGSWVQDSAFRGYHVSTYEFDSEQADLTPPLAFASTSASFGDSLELIGYSASQQAPSGERAWVALQWRVREKTVQDLKVSLALVDAHEHLVGQADSLLMSNEHRFTSGWQPGQVVTTFQLVPSLAGTMPGDYHFRVSLYDSTTMQPLAVRDQQSAAARSSFASGTLHLGEPIRAAILDAEYKSVRSSIAPNLELLGYELGRQSFSPGETVSLALYWQAVGAIAQSYGVNVELLSQGGAIAAEQNDSFTYATLHWRPGDVWRDWHDLELSPDLPSGKYRLVVRLTGAESQTADLVTLDIQGRPHVFTVPQIRYPLADRVGDDFELLGYDIQDPMLKTGDRLQLTLYWRSLSPAAVSYTVFTHLLDSTGRLWGQKDSMPGGGFVPTTSWLGGEVIADAYEIEISPQAPEGEYSVEIGMYDSSTGQRLPVKDASGKPLGDHLLLDRRVAVSRR